ncbi:MAG: DNA-binding protein [Bacteroidales bacterium]|nr:DNA-binding protein [Bacteroidales bacterium]
MLNASETSLFTKKRILLSVVKDFMAFVYKYILINGKHVYATPVRVPNPDRGNGNSKFLHSMVKCFWYFKPKISFILLITFTLSIFHQKVYCQSSDPKFVFKNPPESAKPWVFWYWMHAAITRDGITADLEAMKEAGIGGAYIFTIKGTSNPPMIDTPVEQLTPEWWEMLKFTLSEAGRLGLKIAFHACDGFTTAGGPWITPEMSMQKIIWSDTIIKGGQLLNALLPHPESKLNFYKDIAVYAIPLKEDQLANSFTVTPEVTSSIQGTNAQFLVEKGNKETFRSDGPCWIQYTFKNPFTCRSIKIRRNGNNIQSLRLRVETSNDGINFTPLTQFEPPRHGWQDSEAGHTFAVPPVTARYYRFHYNKEGTEPGSEDYDAAKWKQSLKIQGIELSTAPVIHQYEGKSGAIWRIAPRTSSIRLPDSLCVPLKDVINISDNTDSLGYLSWEVPQGYWRIIRMGHTTTGHTNYIGGAGKGLECDKFNPDIVRIQFDNWFGKLLRITDPDSNQQVLNIFHVDSWECGSQNWSVVFSSEFLKRRGYNLMPYLPVFAGIPVESAETSEKVLYDIRTTIAELITDNFFGTFARLARNNDCLFSAENSSPVMVSDAMRNFEKTDIPMGEFWFNSPTHDKPSDILDAVSAAHIYGKNIVQAEAFTTLRMSWDEHPGMLKTLGDRNYALGINRFAHHVFTHNPWPDRKPGMTLDGVGLFFQRDQTWWKHAKAWVDYHTRCQALLQLGKPVVDIAVFTGEEVPTRALSPDRLIETLPGLFAGEKIKEEKVRLENSGCPVHEMPKGVTNTVNTYRPEFWVNPLRGYQYDSFNKDAFLKYAKVNNGRVEFAGGMSYAILVFPGPLKMNPDGNLISVEVAEKILQLVNDGAKVVLNDLPENTPGLFNSFKNDSMLRWVVAELNQNRQMVDHGDGMVSWKIGKGLLIQAPILAKSFERLGIPSDLEVSCSKSECIENIAWNHRKTENSDIYFVSNQDTVQKSFNLSLRIAGYVPELYNPVTGVISEPASWYFDNGRTVFPVNAPPCGSFFVVFNRMAPADLNRGHAAANELKEFLLPDENWMVHFDKDFGGPQKDLLFDELTSWSLHPLESVRYYSGTAVYSKTLNWKARVDPKKHIYLDLGSVANIAEVSVNNVNCGTVWTHPWCVDITGALKKGNNQLMVKVTNTWANRLMGDHELAEKERITWTTAPYRLGGSPLKESGLMGPVKICITDNNLF